MTKRMKVALALAEARSRALKTPEQRQFAENLVKDPERNQTRAAEGLSRDPKIRGSKWANNPRVKAYIEALTDVALLRIAEDEQKHRTRPPKPPPEPDPETTSIGTELAKYEPSESIIGIAMESAEIITRLSDQARVNILDFLSYAPVLDKGGEPLLNSEGAPVVRPYVDMERIKRLGKGHLVKRWREGKDGIELQLVDSQGALSKLAQIRGLTEDGAGRTPPSADWRAVLAMLPPNLLVALHQAHLAGEARAITTAAVVVEGNGNGNGHH